MAQMTKEARRKLVQDLVQDKESYTREEIVGKVVEASGVTEPTVNSDLDELYPDGLPDVTPEDETEDGPEEDPLKEDLTGEASTPVSDSLVAVPQARAEFVPEIEIGRINPDDYEVDEKEAGIVIIQAERTNFNQITGKKKSRPEVLKCNVRQWPAFRKELPRLGYSWGVILHAPEGVDRNFSLAPPKAAL